MVNGGINVSGVLDFETVPVLMRQVEPLFNQLDKVSVNLAEVTDSNSAGLGFLLEIARAMKLKNKPINFENLPEQIRIVATAYGIDDELGAFLSPQANS